ncbi:MAG: alpha/beta hydrolase, partial [Planctomycetaceae bacterium]
MCWMRLLGIGLLIVAGCSSSEDVSTSPPAPKDAADASIKSSDVASTPEQAKTPTTRTAEVPSADGVVIRYEVRGENENAEQPTLVFIHGWCCNRTFWEPQLAHFAKRFQVVAVDLAGHGKSDAGRENWTMEAFGQDVAAVVNDVGADRVILVGHSMGGPVILEAADILGDKVAGLIPVDA